MKSLIYSMLFVPFAFITVISAPSCKKNNYINKIIPGDTVTVAAKLPYNQLTSFSVPVPGEDSLLASVREDTIYVYWPSYISLPDSAAPSLQVSKNATVSPASGKNIHLQDNLTYNVTAENGDKAVYHLKLVINQALPVFSVQTAGSGYRLGAGIVLTSSYLVPDTSLTHFFLIDKNNNSTPVSKTSGLSVTGATVTVPSSLDTGMYRINVVSAWRSYTTSDLIFINYPNPVITWTRAGVSLHRGDTLIVTGTNFRAVTGVSLVSTATGGNNAVELVSYAIDSMIIKIPDDFPSGTYRGINGNSVIGTGGIFSKIVASSSQYITVVE